MTKIFQQELEALIQKTQKVIKISKSKIKLKIKLKFCKNQKSMKMMVLIMILAKMITAKIIEKKWKS